MGELRVLSVAPSGTRCTASMKGSSWESCGGEPGVLVGRGAVRASMKGSSWESCGLLARPVAREDVGPSMKGSSWESCGRSVLQLHRDGDPYRLH